MSEKLLILKDSIDDVLRSNTFAEYKKIKQLLNQDSQVKMYKFIIDNKEKFSVSVVNHAKLKYVYKYSRLREISKQLDKTFNEIIQLYNEF